MFRRFLPVSAILAILLALPAAAMADGVHLDAVDQAVTVQVSHPAGKTVLSWPGGSVTVDKLLVERTDMDGDGVPDPISGDQCPNTPGTGQDGCPPPPPPDADNDGVPDGQDQCPNQAGPASNNGCPVPPPPLPSKCANQLDDDGDGLVDLADPGCSSAQDDDESNVVQPPPSSGFPNASNTGAPNNCAGCTTTNGSVTASTNGQVIENRIITGSINIRAKNVTVRNSWVYGQIYNQVVGQQYNGLLVEDTTLGPPTGLSGQTTGAIGVNGYTARRVKVINSKEGFRVGGKGTSGDNPVVIEDSYARLNASTCEHADGVQGYDEPSNVTIRHNTIDISGPGCATGAIYVGFEAKLITIQNNLLAGGAHTLRLQEGATKYDHVSGNRIVNNTWDWAPVLCLHPENVADWSDNKIVTVDPGYNITSTVRTLARCGDA